MRNTESKNRRFATPLRYLSVLALAAGLGLVARPGTAFAQVETLVVTTTADLFPSGVHECHIPGQPCGLAQAANYASYYAPNEETINIRVPAGTFKFPHNIYISFQNHEETVHVLGAGQGATILDGSATGSGWNWTGGYGIIRNELPPSGNLTLANMTLQHGSNQYGGAIYTQGSLALVNVTLQQNSAQVGGALYAIAPGSFPNANIISFSGVTMRQNGALQYGGGALASAYEWLISNSTITNNLASGDLTTSTNPTGLGGGLVPFEVSMSIVHSTISNNTANQGGGVYNLGGYVTASRSTFSQNTAMGAGGVGGAFASEVDCCGEQFAHTTFFQNHAYYSGGAVDVGEVDSGVSSHDPYPASFSYSQFTGNTAGLSNGAAPGVGGAIFANGQALNVDRSTFDHNFAYAHPLGLGGYTGLGGAIANFFNLTVNASTFLYNTSASGGGIFTDSACDHTTTVSNSTFHYNQATAGPGTDNGGGGIYSNGLGSNCPSFLINYDTITQNSAAADGGGLFITDPSEAVLGSANTLTGNKATNCPELGDIICF